MLVCLAGTGASPACAAASGAQPLSPADARRQLAARALRALRAAARDGDPEVRAQAVAAFGSLGKPAVIPVLIGALKDKDGFVRVTAAENLARLGDAAGARALQEMAVDRPPAEKASSPVVEEMRTISRGKVRAAAIRALGRVEASADARAR
ncbi:MAG: HEAT repeat domain-containing protein, partial [Elusimicrobia bacterium]|nr:HEAT repeat domain-containing protein [Elusimicrobiota bacterium]